MDDGHTAAADSARPGPTTPPLTSPGSGSNAGLSSAASSANTSGPHKTQVKTSGRVLEPHRLEQYPQMEHRILRGGHDLGNHTMHHLDIAAMDARALMRRSRAAPSACAP